MKRTSFNLDVSARRFDHSQVGRSIGLFAEQIFHAHRTFPRRSGLPRRAWQSVVVCGMGGSALGADVLRFLYEKQLTIPLTIVNGYSIPAFANDHTLVVLITYSGTTEEVLACAREVRARRLSAFCISEGAALATYAREHHIPQYVFTPEYNPSRQPRIGTGYTMTALYVLLRQLGLLKRTAEDLITAARRVRPNADKALSLARETFGQSLILFGAEHLRGNAHVMSNQMNETAKVFAPYYFISEMNHHLLEGLGSLQGSARHWTGVFLTSRNYSPRIRERFRITERVIKKQGFRSIKLSFPGTPVVESLTTLAFGSYWSYYQALLKGLDPAAIPWVDYFKKQLR